MREAIELRVAEEFADLLFEKASTSPGQASLARKVVLSTSDPRYQRVGELQRRLQMEQGKSFFFGWNVIRRYTPEELRRAELFKVGWTSTFEPEGEACGTIYDEAQACRHILVAESKPVIAGHELRMGPYTCGVGARQSTPLMLDGRCIPRGKDFARTIASEEIVSERAKTALERVGVSGVRFEAVAYRGRRRATEQWYQIVATSAPAEITAPTVAGINPFDLDERGTYRCPHGHLIGLNLLSEVSIVRPLRGHSDVVRTRQCVGSRVGVLRPHGILLVSQKVRSAVIEFGLKGWRFEVAHVLSPQ